MSVSIIRHVIPISQPQGSNLCWAAVTAMILGLQKAGAVESVQKKAEGIPKGVGGSLNAETGVAALASLYDLKYTSMSATGTYNGQFFKDRLNKRPLALFGVLATPPAQGGPTGHAVIIHGRVAESDDDLGSSIGTTVLGVDPRGYSAINMSLWNLLKFITPSFVMWRA